jgi:uncharacterized protein
MFVERDATATLNRLARGFPVIWLTGPRQSGKTTLARAVRPELPYVNLERPDERDFAKSDPRGFLAAYPNGALIDEVQHAPELVSWLQAHLESEPQMGQWWLTGSQQPAITAQVSQSLAGRVGRVELLPLSAHELARAQRLPASLDALLFTGGYPALFDRAVSPTDWLGNYVATYVERDVRQLTAVRDLDTFTRFVRMCAARSGQLLNMTSLGNDVGVSSVTVKEWLSLLRATYLIDLIEPFHANLTTRLVKSPKLVFLDVGLMAYLIGINDTSQIATHPLRGALFETWGITEQLKAWRHAGSSTRAMFLRDKFGTEIDLVFEDTGALHAVEFKSGATISSDWFAAIRKLRSRETTANWAKPVIVYGGADDSSRTEVDYVSWQSYLQ